MAENQRSSDSGGDLLRALPPELDGQVGSKGTTPIRRLGRHHRSRVSAHLLALDERDRYLRFGYAATDEQVRRYVEHLDFEQDAIFGVYNRELRLVAMAHLAHSVNARYDACAEFGVSVLTSSRGQGLGTRLFARAIKHARNEGVQLMFIHALSENTAMLSIARKAGAIVERDGAEAQAYLRLPPPTIETRIGEMLEEQWAQTDYRLKRQAKQFWAFLQGVQKIRRTVNEATRRSRP